MDSGKLARTPNNTKPSTTAMRPDMADKERRSRASMETQIYKQAGSVFTFCYTRTASLPLTLR